MKKPTEDATNDLAVIRSMLNECMDQWDEANETTEYSAAAIGEAVAAGLRVWIKDA